MSITFNIKDVSKVSEDIYSCKIKPSEIKHFGKPISNLGGKNIVVVDKLEYDSLNKSVDFSPLDCTVLNVGSDLDTIIIDNTRIDIQNRDGILDQVSDSKTSYGDNELIKEINKFIPQMNGLARKLIQELRKYYTGYFERSETGVYVHRPDNFVAIKVQPRDRSLKISVRGEPDRFQDLTSIEVKKDQHGYSRFKIYENSQIDDLLTIISHTKRK